jgi:hypothetical protein
MYLAKSPNCCQCKHCHCHMAPYYVSIVTMKLLLLQHFVSKNCSYFSHTCYELLLLLPLRNCFYYHNFLVVPSKCKNDMKLYIYDVFFLLMMF